MRPASAPAELLDGRPLLQVGALLVTSPLRTAYDLARRPPLVDGVVALDAFLHAGLISVDDLTAYAADHPRLRGVRQIERVGALAAAGADSPRSRACAWRWCSKQGSLRR